MTTWESFDIVLAILVLPLAVFTIAARQTFVAVVSFVAYGLLLALVWVRLAAPDVALAVAAIGSGLSGVLLLGIAARLRDVEEQAAAARPSALLRVIAAVFSVTSSSVGGKSAGALKVL